MPGLSRLAPLCPGSINLLEDLVSFTGCVLPESLKLLGE
jgi:hypothetical protein